MEENPFKAPAAPVADYREASTGTFVPEGRRLPAGNGYRWLVTGWEMFRTAPATWIGISVAFLALMAVAGVVPILNFAVNLVIPVFAGGIVIGCKAIDDGEGLRFEHLFAGFSRNLGGLLMVGLLFLLAVILVGATFGIVVALGVAGAAITAGTFSPMIVVAALVAAAVFVPIGMAVWLAPPLVVFHDVTAYQAMKTSFFVAWRNFMPFLVYSLVVLVAAIVASIPIFLGWLVLMPVLYASLYAFYRDAFFTE